VTAQAMTNRAQGPRSCPGITEIPVRDLPKHVSGIYRNTCPGITEIRVRELLKSVSGNLRNPQYGESAPTGSALADHAAGTTKNENTKTELDDASAID
jgi:hypothetical protein